MTTTTAMLAATRTNALNASSAAARKVGATATATGESAAQTASTRRRHKEAVIGMTTAALAIAVNALAFSTISLCLSIYLVTRR